MNYRNAIAIVELIQNGQTIRMALAKTGRGECAPEFLGFDLFRRGNFLERDVDPVDNIQYLAFHVEGMDIELIDLTPSLDELSDKESYVRYTINLDTDEEKDGWFFWFTREEKSEKWTERTHEDLFTRLKDSAECWATDGYAQGILP